jgi:predicted RNase H-like nuclease (RuvC/YqgF family)
MDKTPEKTDSIQRETLEWMGRQLASIKAEASRLAEKIRRGGGGGLEDEIAELESRLESYRSKLNFERRNGR